MREVIPAPLPGLDLRREYGHHQSAAIRAGGLVFCSGMVAIDPETGERQHGTVTSEARRIFENLKLLLESAGSSLDRLVQVHAMIYDRIEYDVLNRLYRQYVPNAPPARTVMSVQIEAGFKVMLDVIAAAETRQAAAVTYPRQMIEVRISDADRSRRPGLPLSAAIRAGEFVFLSGLTATDPVTAAPARGTVAAETRLILTNMGQLLEAAGSSLAKVVKVNALIYSMLEYDNMDSVYREFFPTDPPARTACALQLSNGNGVEIECVALAGKSPS
jgi:2-iminobutanoate/2-iminopropanoate deaminase